MTPILSVVVATKNRVPYCIACIESFLSFSETDIQIIIQDNTDNLELKSFISENINDKRLKYRYTPPPFSSIDNFNAAIELATGEYVCMIGDDDAILPDLIKISRWAYKNNIDSISPKNIINYRWPDKNNLGGYIDIPNFTHRHEKVSLDKQLILFLKQGCAKIYRNYGLPALYHGLVRRKCLEEIKLKTGHYVGGLSPDSYSAVALTQTINNHLIIDSPLTIAGACPESTTSQGITGTHRGLLENAPHFRDRENYIWLKDIPKFYSVETIWSESALRALYELKKFNLISNFSNVYLFSFSLIKNFAIKSIIFKYTNEFLKSNKINIFTFYLKSFFLITFLKIKEHTIIKFKKRNTSIYVNKFKNIKTIKNAIKICVNHTKQKN